MTIVLIPVVVSGKSHLKFDKPIILSNPVGKSDLWFGKDKAKHFISSLLITGGTSYISRHRWHEKRQESVRFGMGLALSLGIAKETKDSRTPGNFFSWKDLMADWTGIAVGALLLAGW
jgi:uncharacterized protein YfiM (DUF2279 family)